ncbi:lipoprotein BA_5634 family protein [Sporosarcina sp. FSL K6-3457]|uniref:lipoprotein BA_5634 family protein n=1 Tax=Sporosarcina sp. FSL K6-3457 TaxID=2978204 RepID=UPI0030F55756
MKKTVLGILTMLMAVIVLAGCGMFAKANGIILYGEEEEVLNAVETIKEKEKGEKKEREKEELVEEEQHNIKVLTDDNRQIMILTEQTAQSLIKKKLISEITNQEKGETKAISSLSKVAKGEALLFTKEESYELEIENMNIKYEGNLIIGDGRAYVDMFLIVNDEEWASLEGTEKVMAILKFDKDPSADGFSYEVEKAQLVRIQD